MELERAKQILLAEETIPVVLNGEPVWIESVDVNKEEVQVHLQQNPSERRTVTPGQLQELQ
jgi:H-type small acid-soluble spore protein